MGLAMDLDIWDWIQQTIVLRQGTHYLKVKMDRIKLGISFQQIIRLPVPKRKNIPDVRCQVRARQQIPLRKKYFSHVVFYLFRVQNP